MEKQPQTTEDPENENPNTLQWDINHADITIFIQNHIQTNGSAPSVSLIAQGTGLSRETIYKHLRYMKENRGAENALDTLNMMTEHVIAAVLKKAMRGDPAAQKLYLQTMAKFNNQSAGRQQNNYLQINKTIINQQVIQQLKPEQITRLEQFITRELKKGEG
jgi:hypothetical protein